MFFHIYKGSNWDMSLSNIRLRKSFNANGIDDYCYKLKNQKSFEKKIHKYINKFLKSRSNNSNKAEKQIFEAKTVIRNKL